ncbi:MAG: hypothetical protein COA45_11265 [Zetaproteobacteria bacterium]|nr:MAG: hypothetical protein COA45_11265 [Zetaproteobacteria bacterium]
MNSKYSKLLMAAIPTIGLSFSSDVFAKEYTVKMMTNFDTEKIYYFEPAKLTIQPGDTVKWVMSQEGMHNAVADAGPKGAELFNSPMLEEENASWSFTFSKIQGTYSYHCHPHAAMGMKGTIIVGQASAPEDMESAAGHGNHDHGSMKHDAQEKSIGSAGILGKGVVQKIIISERKINITHDPIPELNWPEMTMDLDVVDTVDIKSLVPREMIKFKIELGEDKVYRIIKIITSHDKNAEDNHMQHNH